MSRQTEKQGIKKDVERALIQADFLKNGRDKFSKKINAETEFFVYPSIGSTRAHVHLTPIAGIENLTLKDRLQNSEHADIDPRACHLLLGSLKGVRDLWGGTSVIYIEKGRSSTDAIRLLLRALDDYALPLLEKYDNKESLIELFTRMSESWRNDPHVIVFDARTKLLALIDHWGAAVV